MKNLSKKQKIFSLIIFIFLLGAFIYVGTRDYKLKETDEHKIFSQEYPVVPKKNVFVYANGSKIYNAIKNDNAIIFFGFKQNDFSGAYAKMLNEVAIEVGVKEILYYDFYEDRKNNNGTYESIVLMLENYLNKNDLGETNLVAPSMLVVKDNQILYYDEETAYTSSNISPEDYWCDYNIGLKEATLNYVFTEYMEGN